MMKKAEGQRAILQRLLIPLFVVALYVIDLRTYTSVIIAELTGATVEGHVLVASESSVIRVEWESSGLVGIAVLAFLFIVTGDVPEFVLSALIYYILNLGLILVAVYLPAAFLAFWFYSAFSIIIAYVLAYYLLARTRYKLNVEKPMPPPPSG